MKSRYDYMTSSTIQDEDNETYPDVLTTNYDSGVFNAIPTKYIINANDISKFWLYFYKKYNEVEYDDLFLNINGIPYTGLLQPGSVLYEPTLDDIIGYLDSKKTGTDE